MPSIVAHVEGPHHRVCAIGNGHLQILENLEDSRHVDTAVDVGEGDADGGETEMKSSK